jgi:undecaprenyl-diphosphatase
MLARRLIQTGWLAYIVILASLIALSRPYLGVHYPSDIVAGAVLGAVVAGVMCWVYLKISERSDQRNETNPM